jgi:ABC-2 type transport system permease protein
MSATTPEVAVTMTRSDSMPASRLLHAYLTEAKYECIRLLREPSFAITFLLLPLLFYTFFGVVMAPANIDAARATTWFIHWSVVATAGPGLFGFGMVLAMERGQGLLTLKRALPAPPAAYLVAKMFMAMLFAAMVMIALFLLGLTLGHVKLSAIQLVSLLGTNMLGALPFCAIGLFIGVRASGRTAPALVNLVYLPSMILAGLFFPLPMSIHGLTYLSPLYYIDQLALNVVGEKSLAGIGSHVVVSPLICLAVLGTLTLLLVNNAVRRLAVVG